MANKRKSHTKAFKIKVALAALANQRTQSQLASDFGVHPSQIKTWKQKALEAIAGAFSRQNRKRATMESALYEEIGRLKIENEFLKKKFQD